MDGRQIMQVALVAGGSSGVGRSVAIRLAERGIGVILTYNGDQRAGVDTVKAIREAGGTAVALSLDVGDIRSFPAFRAAVMAALHNTWQRGRLDFLVNTAGIGQRSLLFDDTAEEVFDRVTRILPKGPYFLTQTLLPLMVDGGTVVNTTSNSTPPSRLDDEGYSLDSSMKGGLIVLTRYMADKLSERGVRVNSNTSGSVHARISDDAFGNFPDALPAISAKTVLGRMREQDDIATFITALLSEENPWTTGQNIEVLSGHNL